MKRNVENFCTWLSLLYFSQVFTIDKNFIFIVEIFDFFFSSLFIFSLFFFTIQLNHFSKRVKVQRFFSSYFSLSLFPIAYLPHGRIKRLLAIESSQLTAWDSFFFSLCAGFTLGDFYFLFFILFVDSKAFATIERQLNSSQFLLNRTRSFLFKMKMQNIYSWGTKIENFFLYFLFHAQTEILLFFFLVISVFMRKFYDSNKFSFYVFSFSLCMKW